VTVGLRSLLAQLRDTRDNVHVHAGNAAKLQRGAQPHGYPDLGLGGSGAEELEGLRAGLAILRDRLAASGRALTDAAENAEKLERDLALARRAYETLAAASAPGSS
jgi:hypothetical protein